MSADLRGLAFKRLIITEACPEPNVGACARMADELGEFVANMKALGCDMKDAKVCHRIDGGHDYEVEWWEP